MKKRRLLWQLYTSYLGITLVALVAVGWFASHSLDRFYGELVRDALARDARWLDSLIETPLDSVNQARVTGICQSATRATDVRITIVLSDGEVYCDTEAGLPLDNHGNRPEVAAALHGEIGHSVRYSNTLQEWMIYEALPMRRDGKIVGAMRCSLGQGAVNTQKQELRSQFWLGGLIVAAIVAVLGWMVSRRISQPVEQMRLAAERLARGDLSYQMLVPDSTEMAELAESLNSMSRQLEERIRTIVRQRNEQEAVLASMVEGVLAVDMEQRIISVNQAAAEFLEADQADMLGRTLQEVIRNVELRHVVTRALEASEPVEGDIVIHVQPERVLRAHGTSLRDGRGHNVGAVVVLNDVTNFRRLENIRRDFVANVSHELKTPITSIKGFVETLLDGALQSPADAERFLRIIAKQAERMHAIIEDLLQLSKIEQSEEAEDIELIDTPVAEVLESATQACQPQAAERRIELKVACSPELMAQVNGALLSQAVVNLLDNAIKYSEPGGTVHISAEAQGDEVCINVRDAGCGIPAEELPRIFERFYRVDKARSRKLGGTGLGLSIVKHIVNVHQGRVTVESVFGRGSTFTIRLPVSQMAAVK
ncbi:MAG: HAMP domain-containing protein [Planctomycetes bacterium]|nr:HAMP domain-containing protein [Planctomycetota bacterium]